MKKNILLALIVVGALPLQADIPYLDPAVDYANGSWAAWGATVVGSALGAGITGYCFENEKDQKGAALLSLGIFGAVLTMVSLGAHSGFKRCLLSPARLVVPILAPIICYGFLVYEINNGVSSDAKKNDTIKFLGKLHVGYYAGAIAGAGMCYGLSRYGIPATVTNV